MYFFGQIDKVYQYLIIALCFVFPLTVAGGNFIAALIIILWLLTGNYKQKFLEITSNRFAIASLLFFSLYPIGLLWTEHMQIGLEMTRKMLEFGLLIPVLITIVRYQNIEYYINAFLAACLLIAILSIFIGYEIIPPFGSARVSNPTPAMSHITHTPFMVFAFYLFLIKIRSAFINKSFFLVIGLSVLSAIVLWSIFFTGGRAGHVMFFIMFLLAIIQFWNLKLKTIFFGFLLSIFTFTFFYNVSPIFGERVDKTIQSFKRYEDDPKSDLGYRITFGRNSLEIIKNNPIFGVGTGDFKWEYWEVKKVLTPNLYGTANPHNMYILVAAQFGIIGLFALLNIFYSQVKIALSSNRFIKDLGIAIVVFFSIINFSDSYMLGHYTSFLFAIFSAFIFKENY